MDVFLPAQNVPESLIANLSPLLESNYLRSGAFQTRAAPLMVLMVMVRPAYQWRPRERMKEQTLQKGINKLWISAVMLGRWNSAEGQMEAAWAGRGWGRGQQPARVDSLQVRGEDWESRLEGKREQAGGFELEGVEGRELWTNKGHHMGFLSGIPGPGDNVVIPIIKKHHVLSKLSTWCWTWWWRGAFMQLTH